METLAERIARDGPVSELDAIGWAIRLAKRLEALHMLGVAHGSVSPACIIAAGQDRNARAYLADLQRTTPSPPYQSPERILGGDISAADDVWALAATLYALLTGQGPFIGGSDAEVRQKILAAAPPPLAVYDVGDDDLQHILDHAFAREIGRRTASITALRRALEEWHPDRGVANLPPLEDEDAPDDDDGARTMMVRDTSHLRQALHGGRGSHPGEHPRAFPDKAPIPRIDNQEDDDEDNVRTMMRSMPKDDLAAMIARATAVAEARVASPGFGERPAPQPGAPALSPPRPGLRRPAPGAYGAAAAPAPAFGGRPAPAPPPTIVDDDSGEDNARTMMRTPEQMDDDGADSSPRTVLLRDGQPQGPLPAAGQPAAPGLPSWGDAAVRGGPAPAATMALPSYFEPAVPGYAPPVAAPDLRGLDGTQRIPPGLGYDPRAQSAAVATLPLDMPPIAGLAGPQQAYAPAPNGGLVGPQAAGSALYPPSPQPSPVLVPQPARSTRKGLVFAAAIALLLAAVATFAFLKLKGL